MAARPREMSGRRREPMRMPPSLPSLTVAPTHQLRLPLDTPVLTRLDAKSRESVVAVLAKLLLEAARPCRASEVADDEP